MLPTLSSVAGLVPNKGRLRATQDRPCNSHELVPLSVAFDQTQIVQGIRESRIHNKVSGSVKDNEVDVATKDLPSTITANRHLEPIWLRKFLRTANLRARKFVPRRYRGMQPRTFRRQKIADGLLGPARFRKINLNNTAIRAKIASRP